MRPKSAVRKAGATRLVFITGTDTGVGKTVLTALLLTHLRRKGRHALAMKPFCSGGRGDVELLSALQDHELDLDIMNPFWFSEPIAPLIAARHRQKRILLKSVLRRVKEAARHCDWLLIEGAGGLLAPVAEDGTALDMIRALGCDVLVAAPNRLGAINHTLLTVSAIQFDTGSRNRKAIDRSRKRLSVCLIDQAEPDASSRDNAGVLEELLGSVPLWRLPFFAGDLSQPDAIKTAAKLFAKKFQKSLARAFC
jgi:dethiobiotin synthetase